MTILSESVKAPLQDYLRKVKAIHKKSCGWVWARTFA